MEIKKSNIFDDKVELKCLHCGKNLLEDAGLSMVQIITDENDNIVRVNPCCKGKCDKALLAQLPKQYNDGWKELSTFTNPYLYLKHVMSMLNNLYDGHKFANEQAFENYKNLLISTAPYVMRNMNSGEEESARFDNACPL